MLKKLAFAAIAATLAGALRPSPAAAQKALVYCPVSIDGTGCNRIVDALGARFPDGIDRGYDGSNGTIDLHKADLQHYAVVVVPSLADNDASKPYALLREVGPRFKMAINGRVAVYAGAPDQGGTNRDAKNSLIANLASWASGGHKYKTGLVGLVAFLDLSADATARYDWIRTMSPADVIADADMQSFGAVDATTDGSSLLSNGGTAIKYANMASLGLHVGTQGAARTTAAASAGTTNRKVVLLKYSLTPDASSDGASFSRVKVGGAQFSTSSADASAAPTSGPTLTTDKQDYLPGDTVTFTGSGFAPNDTVVITLHEDPNWTDPDRTVTAIADASGNFRNHTFVVDQHDFGVTFTATAVGVPSGLTTQITFTDGNATVTGKVTVSGSSPVVAVSGATVSCPATGTANPCNSTVSATTDGSGNYSLGLQSKGSSNTVTLVVSATGFANATANVDVSNSTSPVKNFELTRTSVATTTTVASSGSPSTFGQSVTFTATVAPAIGTTVPTGSVSFAIDGGAPQAGTSAPPVGASATFTFVAAGLTAGAHSVVATFTGTGNFSSSSNSASAFSQVVSKAPLAINADAKSKTFGGPDPTPLTWTYSGFVGTDNAGNVTITGAASCSIDASTSTDVGTYPNAITCAPGTLSAANYSFATGTKGALTINKANATIVLSNLLQNYDGTTKSATATPSPVAAGAAVSYKQGVTSVASPTNAGSYDVTAVLTNSNYQLVDASNTPITSVTGTLVISPAVPAFSNLASPTITYGTTSVVLSGKLLAGALIPMGSVSITLGTGGMAINQSATIGADGSFSQTFNTGTLAASSTPYPIAYSYAASGNFGGASDNTKTLTINKATPVVTAVGGTFSYTGSPQGGTGSAKGVANEDLTPVTLKYVGTGSTNYPESETAPTNAGTYTVTASFGGNGNYNSGTSAAASLVINKVDPTIDVQGYTGIYDGNPHGASGTAKGVKLEALTGLDVGASFTNVPGGTATWTYTDATGNYNNKTGTVAIVISKADATVSVQGYTGVYDGNAHGASGTAKGVKNEDLTGLNLGSSFTNVPGGTANWTFTDATGNYKDQSGSVAIAISQADATLSVQGFTGTYDGNSHGATGTAKGVKGEDLGVLLSLGSTFTNVPGGTANWSFQGNGNYKPASGSVAITISKANATISVNGYSGVYDGNAHGATGSAKGVKNETLNGLSLGASFTDVPGGTANWAFTDATGNYNNASGSVTIQIAKFTPTIDWNTPAAIDQGTQLSGTQLNAVVRGVGGANIGNLGTLTYTPASGTPLFAVGPTALSATFSTSNGNYNGAGPKSVFIQVSNVPPSVAAISAPTDPVPLTTAVTINTSFTDPGSQYDGPYAVVVDWGKDPVTGATLPSSTLTPPSAPGPITASHSYTTAGIYTITVTVKDKNGGTGSNTTTNYVVAYDPNGGFVTGGGWIDSPSGACQVTTICKDATGKANFGFVAKYQNGATKPPTGSTEFQFQAGNINFKSTDYQWLTIAGARAQFKGTGSINGTGSYQFLLTAIDGSINGGGGTDKFRIKIMSADGATVVYDNQASGDTSDTATPTTTLGGGSISIKSK